MRARLVPIALLTVVASVSAIISGCGGAEAGRRRAPSPLNTVFEWVGTSRTDYVLIEQYFVGNPTMRAIQEFCEGKRQDAERHAESGRNFILNFYDDKANPYIACAAFNFNNQPPLEFFKQMPE